MRIEQHSAHSYQLILVVKKTAVLFMWLSVDKKKRKKKHFFWMNPNNLLVES